ncbi:MAG: hypothetical protein HZB56_00340 [Deltaproteobacteria bacterium]|nr:hypothetical protein [Deltaproteobacteria bacterium]
MAARKAAPKPRKAAARKAPPPLPPETGEAPLHALSRDQLSVFLYLALLPEETAGLVRDWGLSQPGFRPQGLGEIQRCDLLADEIRAAPERAGAVIEMLRKAFGPLPLAAWRIDGRGAEELGGLVQSEAALALVLWRLLADPDEAVQAVVRPWLDELAKRYYGPPEGGGPQEPSPAGRAAGDGGPEERIRKLEAELAKERKAVAEERARAEAARRKEEEAREKLQGQLKEARAREAQAAGDAARAREVAEAARRDQARAEAAAAALRGEDAHGEAQRARALARELEGKLHALEARLERAREREAQLAAERDAARSAAPAPASAQGPGEAEAGGEGEEEAQQSWLFPVYTREFYDSLEGWDRRIQRAAFKQAHLLAQDHRHPSLRALPLEGLPGYYRVRVATDVRLLYRRGEKQNAVEILSLIDREDLDRYVRQAKTR